jgi:Calcineurin-like phosphoesterase
MPDMSPGATVRLGVLTDMHLAEPGTADSRWIGRQPLGESASLLSRAMDRLAGMDLDGLVLLGDLTQDGSGSQLAMLADVLSGWGTPVWAVHGNHDLGQAPDPLNAPDASHLVTVPGPAGIDVQGIWLAAGMLAAIGQDAAYREAAVPQPRLWPRGQLAVWLSHFPVADIRPVLMQAGLPHPGDLVNRADVMAVLAGRSGPVLVLAGHTHVRATAAAGRALQLSFPALIEEPHELSVLELGTEAGQPLVTRTAHALAAAVPMGRGDLTPVTEAWAFRSDSWCPARQDD